MFLFFNKFYSIEKNVKNKDFKILPDNHCMNIFYYITLIIHHPLPIIFAVILEQAFIILPLLP